MIRTTCSSFPDSNLFLQVTFVYSLVHHQLPLLCQLMPTFSFLFTLLLRNLSHNYKHPKRTIPWNSKYDKIKLLISRQVALLDFSIYSLSSLFMDSILVIFPTHQNLFVIPNSILVVLLWSLADMHHAQSNKNRSCPTHILPAEVHKALFCLLVLAVILQTGILCEVFLVPGVSYFYAFCWWFHCFTWFNPKYSAEVLSAIPKQKKTVR